MHDGSSLWEVGEGEEGRKGSIARELNVSMFPHIALPDPINNK